MSDLHGDTEKYSRLFQAIREETPTAIFMAGDLLPSALRILHTLDFSHEDFINSYLAKEFQHLKDELGENYPNIFLILGNDDGKYEEASILDVSTRGLWNYINQRSMTMGDYTVYGYSFIPPTPFRLKDWEKYDVSRFTDPGCVPPDEGVRSVPVSDYEMRFGTIKEDLDLLTGQDDLDSAIFLFHSPPYGTLLDRAALDSMMVDHAPLDVHIGSIAIERFIREKQPLLTLHGHVHESTRITGEWRDRIGRTSMFNAADDGPGLSLVRFNPGALDEATRELIL